MATLHRQEPAGRKLRNLMSVAATLCVLGFASLVWLHNAPEATLTAIGPADASSDTPKASFASSATAVATGVPSAESVFRNVPYTPPEEPMAQF